MKSDKSLCIIGAGGHAKVLFETALLAGYNVDVLYDNSKSGQELNGVNIKPLPPLHMLNGRNVAIAIGDCTDRDKYYRDLKSAGCLFPKIIHPSAVISPSAEIGEGTVIFAQCAVNPGAKVGVGVILITACVVEHDCVVGDFSHISPRAALAGGVHIGSRTQVGIGSCVIQYLSIGSDCMIAAGAAVTKSFGDKLMLAGVPAVIKKVK